MHVHVEQELLVKLVLVFQEDLLLALVTLNVPVKEEHQPHLVLVMLFVTVIYKILSIIDYCEAALSET
jgi:hypothetical protein